MKKIFDYLNYRELLNDYYQQKKKSEGYTYRDFSRQAGMNSSSWLLHLIKGKKNLTRDTCARIAKVLRLKKKEREYFNLIVQFTQASTGDAKDLYYKKILELKKQLKIIMITDEHYKYYTKWYHPVVRSLVSRVNFRDNYALLAKKLLPSIKPNEAQKSVALLEKLGFIKRDELGSWVQTNPVISTDDEVASLHVLNYHKQVSRLAEGALDRAGKDDRDISALTLRINRADFALIKSKIQQFRKEIIAIVRNSTNDDRVYQLNFQFFPVSRWEDYNGHE